MYKQLKSLSDTEYETFLKGKPSQQEKQEWMVEHIRDYLNWTYELCGDLRDMTKNGQDKEPTNMLRDLLGKCAKLCGHFIQLRALGDERELKARYIKMVESELERL